MARDTARSRKRRAARPKRAAAQAEERQAAEELAARLGLEFVDVTRFRIDNDLFRSIPFDLMLRYGFIPEEQLPGRLAVIMADPTDVREARRARAAARPAGRAAGRRALGDRGDPAEVASRTQRVLDEATEDFRIQLVQEDERGRGGAVDRPHHRRPVADHQAGRLDDLQRHPAPRLRHPRRDARQRGDHQVPDRRRALPGDGADRQAPPPDHHLRASR